MAMDQDRELVYERKIREVAEVIKEYPVCPANTYRYYPHRTFQVYQRLIGFCGKVYPVLQLGSGVHQESVLAYSVDDVDEFVLARYKEKEVDAYFSKDWNNTWARSDRHDKFAQYFDEAKKKELAYTDIFQKYGVPIWVYDTNKNLNKLILNAPLKQLEFYRVMDAYTTYQELLMFYGGLAQPLKPIPKLDDETMVEIKGFDPKYGFRKPPSKG